MKPKKHFKFLVLLEITQSKRLWEP